MRHIRIITALILALLWVPSTAHCLLAAEFPKAFGPGCECDGEATDGNKAPVEDGTCNQCVTLENGVNLSSLTPLMVTPPVFWEEYALAEWLRAFTQLAALESDEVPISAPVWSPPIVRTLMLTKALPVRGPSPVV